MRVRISYSVDLDEVPSESTRMCNESLNQLQDALDDIRSLIQKIDSGDLDKEELILKVDSSRKNLGAVDARLTDIAMILSGFYDAKEQMALELAKEEPEGLPVDTEVMEVQDVE